MHRGFRYELKPTLAQAETLRGWVGTVRFVYNLCLEQRRDFWRHYRRQTAQHLNWVAQSREVTELRAQVDWIAAAPRDALDFAVRDLELAFGKFFTGKTGYPTPRVRGRNDAFRLKPNWVHVRRLNAKWSQAKIPKVGWIKFRDTRPLAGRTCNVTITLAAGRWYVTFAQQIDASAPEARSESVGIDRGVAQTLALSNGEMVAIPPQAGLNRRVSKAQRRLSRAVKGSARRKLRAARVARLRAQGARRRADWCHRTSTGIARRFGLVAIEDLKITNMTATARGTAEEPGRMVRQKAGLNRSILEQCWGKFADFLDYKLTERGGVLISVPAAYTSQTCAGCGVVDSRSRKSQAVFACIHCGHEDNADVNAAKEILRRSTALLDVEGSHWRPAEASIMAAA